MNPEVNVIETCSFYTFVRPHPVLETSHVSAERPPKPLLPSHCGHVSHIISGHVSQVIIVTSHNNIVRRPWRRGGAQQTRAGREYCSVVTNDVAVVVVVC